MRFDIYPGKWGSTYVDLQIGKDTHRMEMEPYTMCSDTLNGLLWATDALRWRKNDSDAARLLKTQGDERFLMTDKDRSTFYDFMDGNNGWELIYSKDGTVPKKIEMSRDFQYENGDRGVRYYYGSREMFICHRYVWFMRSEGSEITKKKTATCRVECIATGVSWMGEFDVDNTQWILEKPAMDGEDPMLYLTIYLLPHDEETPEQYLRYAVSYREFCYALAAGVTRVYKSWGLMGFLKTAYYEDWKGYLLALEPFLRIKAYALGREWAILPQRVSKDRHITDCVSSFDAEMRILQEDME